MNTELYFPTVAISPDGRNMFVSNNARNQILCIDMNSWTVKHCAGSGEEGNVLVPNDPLATDMFAILSVTVTPDSKSLVVTDRGNNRVLCIDLIAKTVVPWISDTLSYPCNTSISPDGTFALVSDWGNNRVLRIWLPSLAMELFAGANYSYVEWKNYVCLEDARKTQLRQPSRVCISPNGKTACIMDINQVLEVDCSTGSVEVLWSGNCLPSNSMAFSRDGRNLAFGTKSGVTVVNAKTMRVLRDYEIVCDGRGLTSVAFAPDSSFFAADPERGRILFVPADDEYQEGLRHYEDFNLRAYVDLKILSSVPLTVSTPTGSSARAWQELRIAFYYRAFRRFPRDLVKHVLQFLDLDPAQPYLCLRAKMQLGLLLDSGISATKKRRVSDE